MSRCLLHKTKLTPFKVWLTLQGIEHRPGRGDYQVLQVLTKSGAWQCVFDRNVAPEHYTVAGPIEFLVRRFIKSGREAKVKIEDHMKKDSVVVAALPQQDGAQDKEGE